MRFSNRFLKRVVRYLPPEMQTKWTSLKTRMDHDSTIRIANTGLYSAGKSSLFNALLDAEEESGFEVGAAPTTKSMDLAAWGDALELADTPGIDANQADNQAALDALLGADLILILHNINQGELDACECHWIKDIAERMETTAERQARLLFVCSHIDSRDRNPEQMNDTIGKIRTKLQEILLCDIPFFAVSAQRYQRGVKLGKTTLIEKSGIPDLRNALLQQAEAFREQKQELLSMELYVHCKASRELLLDGMKKRSSSIDVIVENTSRKYTRFLDIWRRKYQKMREQYDRVQSKQRELQKIENS